MIGERLTLEDLRRDARAFARAELAKLLVARECGASSSITSSIRDPARINAARSVTIRVYTDAAYASRLAWADYWEPLDWETRDEVLAAAAPPRPRGEIGATITATWTQIAAWLRRPEQLDLFDPVNEDAP